MRKTKEGGREEGEGEGGEGEGRGGAEGEAGMGLGVGRRQAGQKQIPYLIRYLVHQVEEWHEEGQGEGHGEELGERRAEGPKGGDVATRQAGEVALEEGAEGNLPCKRQQTLGHRPQRSGDGRRTSMQWGGLMTSHSGC